MQKKASSGKSRATSPDPVDIHVGSRLRLRRNLVGLTQEQLGKASDLTFQQIQKYERGINRMGASRLFHVAQFLKVPVSYFFDGMEESDIDPSLVPQGFAEDKQAEFGLTSKGSKEKESLNINIDDENIYRRETLELIRAYYSISDKKQRRKVFELIKSMVD